MAKHKISAHVGKKHHKKGRGKKHHGGKKTVTKA